MIVELYAGGVLAYDSRLPEESSYNVLSIAITESVNKGGSATIILPHGHPLWAGFPAFRTQVEIYRDGKLRWRGRPLPPSDDFYNRRTIVCEGELCFLQDAIHRPYLYQDSPANIFAQVIAVYNAAVEPWKQFAVGTVTVTDPNDYIRLEGQNPATVLAVIQKLIDRCGGYIFFDTAEDGTRRINWYASMPYRCNQTVRFGENLIDYSSQPDAANLATRIIPYGAAGEDGQRLKLDIDGRDYVQNDDTVALRGIIEAAAIYDDITLPENLEARAKQDLMTRSLIPDVISLSAIDLSRQDLTLDAFAVGQQVPADSSPHQLSGLFDLTALTEDLVNPTVGSITLTRETASLTGGDGRTLTGAIAAGDRNNSMTLEKAEQEIRTDYQKNIAKVQQSLSTEISQTASDILLEASYIQQDVNKVKQDIASLTVDSDSISAKVSQQDGSIAGIVEQLSAISQRYNSVVIQIQSVLDNGVGQVVTGTGYTLSDIGLLIEKLGQEIKTLIDNTGMYIERSGETMLQVNSDGVVATDVTVRNYLIVGTHARFEDYGEDRTACFYI